MHRLLCLLAALLLAQPASAATTCTTMRKVCSGSASSATWLEIRLPAGTVSVVIEVDGAAWVDGPGGGYTDGAAWSSGGRSTTSGESLIWPIVEGASKSLYVAGNGGARTVTVIPFGAEAK